MRQRKRGGFTSAVLETGRSHGPGIVLGGSDGVCGEADDDVNDSRIEGNSVVDSAGPGIVICSGEDNVVRENEVRSPGTTDPTNGIQLAGYADSNCVRDNLVSRASHNGIAALAESEFNVIANNKSTGNTAADINDLNNPTSNIWGDNICHDSGGTAGACVHKVSDPMCDL